MSLRERCALRQRREKNRRTELLRKFDSLVPSAATFDLLTIDKRRIFARADPFSELRQSRGIWRKAVAHCANDGVAQGGLVPIVTRDRDINRTGRLLQGDRIGLPN